MGRVGMLSTSDRSHDFGGARFFWDGGGGLGGRGKGQANEFVGQDRR